MVSLSAAINWLVYSSVTLGVALLLQLYYLVPTWLFSSVLIGWVAYAATAIAIALGRKRVYPVAFILAILTLAVSLPQPEHYSFVEQGAAMASLTFIVGSGLQLALILLIPAYYLRRRNRGA